MLVQVAGIDLGSPLPFPHAVPFPREISPPPQFHTDCQERYQAIPRNPVAQTRLMGLAPQQDAGRRAGRATLVSDGSGSALAGQPGVPGRAGTRAARSRCQPAPQACGSASPPAARSSAAATSLELRGARRLEDRGGAVHGRGLAVRQADAGGMAADYRGSWQTAPTRSPAGARAQTSAETPRQSTGAHSCLSALKNLYLKGPAPLPPLTARG
jgi:hypothetical protein